VDNAALRNNRLALLHEISSLFESFADFTRLS
jgi:glycyl-tRNA synthetase beta subunit